MRHRHCQFLQFLIAASLLLGLAGCESVWMPATANHKSAKLGLSADLPTGWQRYTPDKDLVLTRDGFLLQIIRVSREAFGTKLAHTERTITKDALPQDAAQTLIDSVSADASHQRLQVVSNDPITVDGRPGFRIEIVYGTPEGPTMRETICGVLTDDGYVLARYTAPDRHYHERTAVDFERLVASLKIEPRSAKS